MYCCVEPDANAMVPTSQFVVEDYILYRIRRNNPNYSKASSVQLNSSNKPIEKIQLSENRRPTELNLTVRKLSTEYERRYGSNFTNLLEEMKTTVVSSDNMATTLKRVANMLFQLPLKPLTNINDEVVTEQANYNLYIAPNGVLSYDDHHINWGHVIAFLVFAGLLATRAAEDDSREEVDVIIDWVAQLYDNQLAGWLAKNGSWNALVEWGGAGENGNSLRAYDDYDSPDNVSIRSVMSVGVLAACVGFGAMVMARK